MNSRLILGAHRFENLAEEEDAGPRLTKMLGVLADAINDINAVLVLDPPSGLTATGTTGGVLLGWDPVPEDQIDSLYGARIWRCKQSLSAETSFTGNSQKRVLVSWVASTAYFDPTGDTDTYLYWVQWIDRLSRATLATGAKTGAGL